MNKTSRPNTASASAFPRIVRFLGTADCGDGASCPHCGATGRYITTFIVEGGRTGGAMRGCLKLFPVSALAFAQARLIKKAERYAKQSPPWTLSRRDREAMAAIEAAIDGQGDERIALSLAESARKAGAWKAGP